MRTVSLSLIMLFLLGCPSSPSTQAKKSAQTTESTAEPEFRQLTLADFVPFKGEENTWTEQGGILQTTGTPKGYLHTKESFTNYVLKCDFQFEPSDERKKNLEKANTGFLLAIQEPQKVWPRSLEVQGRWDMMGSVNPNGGVTAPVIHDQPEVREKVRRPVGEWNSVEIVMQDGAITSYLNGEIVCTSEAGEVTQGQIGLQAEGDVVRFRNLQIKVLSK